MQKLTLKEKMELEEIFTSMKKIKKGSRYREFYKFLIKKLLPTTKSRTLIKN